MLILVHSLLELSFILQIKWAISLDWKDSVLNFYMQLICREAVVISVVNVSGSVSPDNDGSWVCTDANRKRESISNPVSLKG